MSVKFNKNGIVSAPYGFSDCGLIEDMKIKTLGDGSVWARVFYHNCVGGTVLFTSAAEVLNTQTTNKYSRLYMLDQFKASDNKFEFMLCYPDDTTSYNRWKQSNNPCNEYVTPTTEGTANAAGYEAISIAWSTNYWGGLTRQNSNPNTVSNSYLSGSVGHANYFYAIGSYSAFKTGIPSYGSSTATVVELWVRTDTVSKSKQLKISNNYILANDFIEL